ncbi:FKBP-type peptidyl-prolyl cis-trans isomerase [Flavobacterium agrisoli]|uniref:Peptidyl-prolyl cis-trans isomerase n=1 Tax=Flavobacterium agrisoli TaxID=2793066 RepID=A0A934PK83_9FLAO|nr:FKBP-type peptidyl-prolyl cis-trans isomerase [Flavobacterium agrisoli]MBK0369671.1 FKBP-type peptidyl-prolyl cis-trans isomerase [Flavobacterium agrisoli]
MKYFAFILFFFVAISCKKNASQMVDYSVKNETDIQAYIKKHKLKVQKTASGLYYAITKPGTGKQPTASDNVTVAYKGYFLDQNVFDESPKEGISFGLNQVIKGWTEGIPLFTEGAEGILIIPSKLGYGDQDFSRIPGGSVLVFDIHLISVN